MNFLLPDFAATDRLGADIAAQLRAGDVIELHGSLGAGKTTLARSIIRALGYTGEVPSPTFTLIESYEPPNVSLPVAHADFYRLTNPYEVVELGLDDYRSDGVLLAEWPDKAGGFQHEKQSLSVYLQSTGLENGDKGRIAIVESGQDWLTRFP